MTCRASSPLLLLVVFGYAANFTVEHVPTAVVGPQAEQAAAALPDFFDVTVIAPTEHLKTQWADAAGRVGIHLDPRFSNSLASNSPVFLAISVSAMSSRSWSGFTSPISRK